MANLDVVLEQLREQRDETARELKHLDQAIAVLGGGAGTNHAGRGRGRRRMSAAARRRIAAAQRARWAKWKAARRKKAA